VTRIDRRAFLEQTGRGAVGLSLALPALSCAGGPAPETRPNLLIVFPDQMRTQALGLVGEDPVVTPRLDGFAAEGLFLPQAISNYPICSPFRAQFLTGLYPHANGVLGNCNTSGTEHGIELRTDAVCWSDVLKADGYSLGYIGKWHLDAPRRPYVRSSNNTDDFAWNEWCSPDRRHGFDFWYAYGTYDQHMNPMYWATDSPRDAPLWIHQWGPEHEADQALRFIRNDGGGFRDPAKPFALVVSMNPPHMPYDQVPGRYLDLYRDADIEALCNRPNIPPAGTRWGDYYRASIGGYLAMTTGVDEHFGRILDGLRDEGLEDETIVVFMSDHGNCLGIHEQISKNVHFEESVRIPFIVRWPGRIAPRRDDLLLSVPDIAPTLLDLMGLADRVPPGVEGVSHAGIFRGGAGRRPSSQLYMAVPYGQPAAGQRGTRTDRYTLVVGVGPDGPAETVLHDNREDPYQLRNVAADRPALVRSLIADELAPWLEKTRDPFRIP